jgi:trimeric autotransporter adhesin
MKWHRNGLIVLFSMIGLHSSVLWGQNPVNFVGIPPCRLVDTRNATGTFGGPSLPPLTERSFPVLSASCGIPATATGYSLNVTVVPTGFLGYLTIWPTGVTRPLASTVNSYLGVAVANAALVVGGSNGAVSVYATNTTDVILDIDGYFVGQSTDVSESTAFGTDALPTSSTGSDNTAFGLGALGNNSSGDDNVGVGTFTLESNTTGVGNTALGSGALQDNTSDYNTAVGTIALGSNTTGNQNTAVGVEALASNTTGNQNTALGRSALDNAITGVSNIGVGYLAGDHVTNGSNNIDIGNLGSSADSNVIRIGDPATHTSTYIAGIAGATVTGGSAVLVDPVTGQLGIAVSSKRFKQDVHDMDAASDALMQLRPVTFRYKGTGSEAEGLQYGLIAEEVAAVYPQLVVYGRDGQVESVQYHQLPALLLNEVQKQHQKVQAQREEIHSLEARIAALEASLSEKLQPTKAGGN